MKLRILAAVSAGIVGASMFAVPAQAAGNTTCRSLENSSGRLLAGGCFDSYGDRVTATDFYADGLRAVVELRTDYGRTGDECHDAGGSADGGVVCNFNMREDGEVQFRVVVRNGARGANVNETEWTPWIPIGN